MTRQTAALAGLPAAPDCLYVMVFAGTLFVYNYSTGDRWRRLDGWFFTLCVIACWLELPVHTRLAALLPAVIWVLYRGFPEWPGMRNNAWAKPSAVALAWALVTVYLPLPSADWVACSGILLQRFFFILALALGYDLLDRSTDRQQGLRTLAGQLGVQATLRVLYICLAVSGFLACVNAALGIYSWHFVPAFLLSLFISAWLIPWQLRQFGPQQWQKITIDGLMIVQAVFVGLVR